MISSEMMQKGVGGVVRPPFGVKIEFLVSCQEKLRWTLVDLGLYMYNIT